MKISDFLKFRFKTIILIIALAALGCGLTAYSSYLLTTTANAVKNLDMVNFLIYSLLSTITSIVSYMLIYTGRFLYTKYEQKYLHHIRQEIITNYYDNGQNDGNVANMQNSLTNDLNMLTEMFLDPLFKILNFILDIVFSISVVLTFNIYLLLLIVILAIMLLFLPKLISKPLQNLTNNVSEKNQLYIDLIQKWINGLAILQRYQAKSKLLSVLSDGASALEGAKVKKEKELTKIDTLSTSLNMLAQSLVLFLAGFLIIIKQLNFGVFFSIGNFASLVFSELVALNQNVTLIQSAKMLNAKIAKDIEPIPTYTKEISGNIDCFASLNITGLRKDFANGEHLSYPNIQIKAGEKILLSGDSGTGKSTLFKLILHELEPTSGEITFKDEHGKIIQPNLNRIGYIPQDPILFPGTIKENITMFNSKLNKTAQIWAQKMQLADDLEKFPQGIETYVDLDKNNLSGGQRQKIVLARTKVYRSKLILIDEGTSAIDERATLSILKNLLFGPETIIFIAHNWSPELHDMFDREIILKK